jgi:plasmid stabilization system protein ParE
VTELGPEAERQLDDLINHYDALGRIEAMRNLRAAIRQGAARIARDPGGGLHAPRPYPELAHEGERWIKQGQYWIAYSLTTPPVILAVFHDQADLPRRVR